MKKDLTKDELVQKNEELNAQVISLQKEVELLRKSFLPTENYYKDRFYRINENVNDVVYRFNFLEKRHEYISPQVENVFGYSPEDFYNNPFLIRHIIHPDCIRDYINHWKDILHGNMPEYFEIKIIKRNGDIRWVMQKNLAINNDKGELVAIEGIVTDITERKKTDQALIESEAQKNAILNNLPHLAWMKNCEGRYLSVNVAFAKRYNKSVEEIVGGTDFDIYPNTIAQQFCDSDLRVIQTKKQLFIEEESDESYWETIKAPIFNNKGEVIGVTGVSLSVTEQKSREVEIKEFSEKLAIQNIKQKLINDELKLAKEKAEEADRLKTAFLANMSHEIRTPMNAILGFATLLRDRKLTDEKQFEFINLINTNSRQLLHIISDIIDISKIESDQITIFNKDFSINKVINNLKLNFENNILALKKEIQIITKVELKDNKDQLITDKVRLEQILSNLISNAVKFTEKGKIECGYHINSRLKEIEFFVSDTGIGMTIEEQDVIFDRFRQVSSSYSKMYGGTGLGLSISKGLAQRLGGRISVKSEVGVGSTFYLSIPFKTSNIIKPEKIAYDTKYNWKGRNILIAEDEIANYTLLESIILPTKAKIFWAKNGVDAVKICNENKNIDLVLMDIKMPEMNGLEATRNIRLENKNLPIIAQTAFAMPQDEENCLLAGCDDYLSKPLKVEEILSKINHYILKKTSVSISKGSKSVKSQ